MTVCIVDTSIFCNVLDIPGKNQRCDEARGELAKHIEAQWSLLLPMVAIIETGNHIGHLRDGGDRRRYAERFRDEVRKACNGEAPWVTTPFPDKDSILEWLDDFPEHAACGRGFGDRSIVAEFDRQCILNRARRVLIWSLDRDLAGYDRRL
ncbi:hypothetical protein EV699_1236 [Plasticicumulans lactativorans]|uniref:PIN domain-containing protein n=1 Tax=Plasticicumulans lactativorans TaxID=1133106 RepID=A0A4R2L2K8_9GAMM|nr:hypothetical protein [Plasticicumulans lactativorans]TCO78129.1 hypothetical protein EV699_1236 [Plasticicumulans lactativorans]